MKRLTAALLGASAAALLGGCGVRGDLERPPPLWGDDRRTAEERAYETEDDAPSASDDGDDGGR